MSAHQHPRSHRQEGAKVPVPNWLKAFYALLLFLAFTVTVSTFVTYK